MRRHRACTIATLLLGLLLPVAAGAQTLSTADLAGTWRVFQLATPPGAVSQASIRSYAGQVTFDAAGTATAGSLADDQGIVYTLTGALTLSPAGLVQGVLDLADGGTPAGTLAVNEARLLATKFTILGTATVLDQVGLFTLVRTDADQTFSLNADVATGADRDGDGVPDGTYGYHEITPVDQSSPTAPGDAGWSTGTITFHGNLDDPTQGCTEADLTRADGSVRAQRDGSSNSYG
jgi:hypothetical protein